MLCYSLFLHISFPSGTFLLYSLHAFSSSTGSHPIFDVLLLFNTFVFFLSISFFLLPIVIPNINLHHMLLFHILSPLFFILQAATPVISSTKFIVARLPPLHNRFTVCPLTGRRICRSFSLCMNWDTQHPPFSSFLPSLCPAVLCNCTRLVLQFKTP